MGGVQSSRYPCCADGLMAAECAALGGKVLVAPTDIAGVGRFAVLQDPQGAFFNIIDYLDT